MGNIMVFKDEQGRLRFKIVVYGPSLAGKTTMLRHLYSSMDKTLKKGKMRSVEESSTGRTLYFDYAPISASGRVTFDIYTVPGQRRHKNQRKIVLEGADGIVFVADSDPKALRENKYSLQELEDFLGDKWGDIPILYTLNKRDLEDALPPSVILNSLGVNSSSDVPVFKTVAIDGLGIKRVFQEAAQACVLWRLHPELYKKKRQ